MNREVRPQLMTIEEAMQLSDPSTSHEANRERRQQQWAWQTLSGAMSMTITDEQIEKMAALAARRRDK